MSISSDISNLFKQFGGRPDQYQEIAQANDEQQSHVRWPNITQPDSTAMPVGDEKSAALFSLRESNPSVTATAAPEAPAVVAEPEPVAARGRPSLQSLLAKLAQDGQHATAVKSEALPQLSNITVIAVVSAKGGVGKSTMAANLAAALHKHGRSVLAIDLDPQNALHHHFEAIPGQERDAANVGIADPDLDWRSIGVPSTTGVFVVPYGAVDEKHRRAFESQLDNQPQWLARQLSDLQLADGAIVVIDTPPGPSLYLQQALAVANIALVVSLSDAASFTALPLIEGLIKTHTAERADFIGAVYLINQLDSSRQLSKDITQIMQAQLGEQVVGVVHRDQSICEALAYNRNVMDYDPNGRGCLDIQRCAKTLLSLVAVNAQAEQPA